MQAKRLGARHGGQRVNVREIRAPRPRLRGHRVRAARAQREGALREDLGPVHALEDGGEKAAVLVVRDAAAVVALADDVTQSGKRHGVVVAHVRVQLARRDAEVAIVEAVRNVPPARCPLHSGASHALQHNC